MTDCPPVARAVAHLSNTSPPLPSPSDLAAGRFPHHGRARRQRRSDAASRSPLMTSWPALDLALARTVWSSGGPCGRVVRSGKGHSGVPHRRLVRKAPRTPRPPLHLRPHPHLGLPGRAADGSYGPREGRVGVQVMVHQLGVAPAQPLCDVVCAHHVVHVNPPPHARTLGAWRVTGTAT